MVPIQWILPSQNGCSFSAEGLVIWISLGFHFRKCLLSCCFIVNLLLFWFEFKISASMTIYFVLLLFLFSSEEVISFYRSYYYWRIPSPPSTTTERKKKERKNGKNKHEKLRKNWEWYFLKAGSMCQKFGKFTIYAKPSS